MPQVKDWITSQFDVIYESDTTYHLLLWHAGLSFKYPQVFDKRRSSDTDINARMSQIRDEIAQALHDPDQVVLPLMKSVSSMKQRCAKPGSIKVIPPC